MQNSGNQKHRSNNTAKPPTRQYYTGQGKFCIEYTNNFMLAINSILN